MTSEWTSLLLHRPTSRSPENGHSSDTESRVKEKVRLMEEFLHLLIILVSERYEPGIGQVTREDKLAREVIHQLCISPMAHSELVRGLQDSGQLELVRIWNVVRVFFQHSSRPCRAREILKPCSKKWLISSQFVESAQSIEQPISL